MSEPQEFDAIVIGSGAGMNHLAIPAIKKGMNVCLIEETEVGGTCLNRGCIPSKMLIQPAVLLADIKESPRLHVECTPPSVNIHQENLVHEVNSTVQNESKETISQLEQYKNLKLLRGRAKFVDKKVISVGDQTITAKKIFIGIGAHPSIPPIPGLEKSPYITSNEALKLDTVPKRLGVIGGGYIGCELGFYFHEMGSEVHLLEMAPVLLTGEDREIQQGFHEEFSKKINTNLEVNITEVQYAGGVFKISFEDKDKKNHQLEVDQLLITTGVQSNGPSLDPNMSGIELSEKGNIKVDKNLKTTCEGVWAFGDCVGNFKFRHSANFEADYLCRTALLPESPKSDPINYPPMPHVVFSFPEVAAVGMTEEEVQEKKIPYVKGFVPYIKSGKGMALRSDYGFLKTLVHKQDRSILGVHILGKDSSTLLHEVLAVMVMNGKMEDILRIIHVHPSLNELVRNVFRNCRDKLMEENGNVPEDIQWV